MVIHYVEDRIFLLPDVMGKSILAAYQTRSVNVALLESINADRDDQRFDHCISDDGIREQI